MARCVPSFPKDVVGIALRTFGKFWMVERVNNVQRLEVCRHWYDSRHGTTFLDVDVRWRKEPWTEDRNFFP
jgi:hypothetical protein